MIFPTAQYAIECALRRCGADSYSTGLFEDKNIRIKPVFTALLENKGIPEEEKNAVREALDGQRAYRFVAGDGTEMCIIIMPFGEGFFAWLKNLRTSAIFKL